MYDCLCNAITDKQIRDAAKAGATDLWALQHELGVGSQCGSCKESAAEILNELRSKKAHEAGVAQPLLYQPNTV